MSKHRDNTVEVDAPSRATHTFNGDKAYELGIPSEYLCPACSPGRHKK